MRASCPDLRRARGATLVELMVALIVLSLGILAVAQLFPAGTRTQLRDRMTTTASYYAQETIEQLCNRDWSDPALIPGRYPPGTATENLGAGGQWRRFYEVELLPPPLDNVKKIRVQVDWTFPTDRSVVATTYLRR